MTILYGRPDDPEAFDRYYRETHIPIARRMQGLTRWTLTWTGSQSGDDVAREVYLVVDLWAPDKQALQAVLDSEAGRAASADVPNFATGGVTFLEGVEEEVPTA